jgi:DNA-directed RNA polymerase subunit omega
MARTHDTMMNPPIEDLLYRVDSKFMLVTVAARRARQINAYFNQLGEGLGTVVPPQVTSVARKPLSIGFEEIAAGKIGYEKIEAGEDEGEEGDEGAAELADGLPIGSSDSAESDGSSTAGSDPARS